MDRPRADAHGRHGFDLVVCGNALYVTGGMGNFGAANVKDTVEAFTLDGSAPTARSPHRPRRSPPGRRAERAGAGRLPEVRRVAARIGAAGAGLFCTI